MSGGIVPKKKVSKTQTRTRHATWQTINVKKMDKTYKLTVCKNCWKKKLSHQVCPYCGYYKGKQVVTIKTKSKEKVVDA